MRKIDIYVPLILIVIGLLVVWILAIINPTIIPFAIGFAILLLIFILASFCSGRYTYASSPSEAYAFRH